MGYRISLTDPVTGEELELDEPHHMRGGTYAVGGDTRLCLNVTYNYAVFYLRTFTEVTERVIPPRIARHCSDHRPLYGIRTIYGLSGAESIPVLDAAIAALGDDVDDDYWKATEGNAKRALLQLRAMACMRPDGIWVGD